MFTWRYLAPVRVARTEGLRAYPPDGALRQPRLIALDALGEAGRLDAPKLEGYFPRSPRRVAEKWNRG